MPQKVLALNGSPRGEKSCTARMLKPLLKGMQKAGAQTDVIHLAQLKIEPCRGCFACWMSEEGKCCIKDDMPQVLEKIIPADILIFGTPLYHFTMTGIFKNCIDRTVPMAEPFQIEDPDTPGVTAHPHKYPKERAALLVSPCGFPEAEHFKALVDWFDYYMVKTGMKNLGHILRPAGEMLLIDQVQLLIGWYYKTLEKAGEQIIKNGKIDQKTQKELLKDFFPGGAAMYRKQANDYFAKIRAKSVKT